MEFGGWYPDPDGGPERVRWWDGRAWTEHTAVRGDPATAGPPGTRPAARPDVVESSGGSRRLRVPLVLTGAVVVALVVTAVLTGNVGSSAHDHPAAAPTASQQRPPLAQRCTTAGEHPAVPRSHVVPAPTGPRTTDRVAHVSYAAMGRPFRAWDLGPWGTESGGLGESFTTGQYFVTQQQTPAGAYLATVLSGTVPATYGDDPHPDVRCAARVIAEDVRHSYYPLPNTRTDVSSGARSVDGRPAYEVRFHLTFHRPGYDARGEQVGICVVDVPGPKAAAVYVSIPDTHRRYDPVIGRVLDSVRLVP